MLGAPFGGVKMKEYSAEQLSRFSSAIHNFVNLALRGNYRNEVYYFDKYLNNQIHEQKSRLKRLDDAEWNLMALIWINLTKIGKEKLIYLFVDLVTSANVYELLDREYLDYCVGWLSETMGLPIIISPGKVKMIALRKRVYLNAKYRRYDIVSPCYRFSSLGGL